jgi:hypothetical protein
MVDLEELKRDLLDLVRRAGRLSADELLKWAGERGLAPLTLYILVEEVLATGEVREGGGRRVIDEHFNIDIPSYLEPAKREEVRQEEPPSQLLLPLQRAARATPEKRERARTRRKVRPTGGSLLRFLAAEEVEEHAATAAQPVEEAETAATSEAQEAPTAPEALAGEVAPAPPPPQTAEQQQAVPPELADLLADEDLAKAVRYLGRYWSVGRLRFLEDLEELGVKNPRKVLEELWKRGLIEIVEPGFGGAGVINATEALLQLAEKVQPVKRSSLFEVFGGGKSGS